MKSYAIKILSDNSIQIIQCKGNPENFMPFHIETSGSGTEEDPIIETKVLDAELIGEVSKDEDGKYTYPERYFRNSWRKSGSSSINVNLSSARSEKMSKLREERDAKLKEKDDEQNKEISKRRDLAHADVVAIFDEKDALRDMPATRQSEIDAISDVEELKNYVPAELA